MKRFKIENLTSPGLTSAKELKKCMERIRKEREDRKRRIKEIAESMRQKANGGWNTEASQHVVEKPLTWGEDE